MFVLHVSGWVFVFGGFFPPSIWLYVFYLSVCLTKFKFSPVHSLLA